MAEVDVQFEGRILDSPYPDEYAQQYDQSDFFNYDTNVLTLDEDRPPGSVMADSVLGGDSSRYGDGNDGDTCNQVTDDNSEMQEKEVCVDGILDEDTAGDGLSNLGRSADGTAQVFLHLTLPGYNIKDIGILQDYIHLQKIEIPYNEVTDLSPLGYMPYLLEINASHNQISSLLDFTAPKNLKTVDLSFNNITEMADLSEHHYLQHLVLDNNHIKDICGLGNCKRLHHLSLAHNKITTIQGLDNLPIKSLNLSNNEIKKISNIGSLHHLQMINLSGNQVRSLNGLQGHGFLESVDVEDNEVIDLSEIQYLKGLHLLRELNLLRNPIQEFPDYRLSILYHLQKLGELDRHRVTVEEKVGANNLFNPPMEVMAARDHIMHIVYSFSQPSRILECTLPSVETPYPMLVLVGPQGAGKKDLSMKLVEEFPDYFGYGVSHTTRSPLPEEKNSKDYYFVTQDQFELDVKLGQFIQTYSYHGNLYGLTISSVESVARESLACVVHMELEGVLTMKNTYFEPRYVLIMPLDGDIHERRLRDRGIYSEDQIRWTLSRSELYAEYNREHPGFFDMMISSDDITDAYRRLRRLVMDYLGISGGSPPSVSDMADTSRPESQVVDRENTDMTAASPNLGNRTWSKPSLPESATGPPAANSVMVKTMSPMPQMGRGVVEEESLRRRQSAAKDAIAGLMPTIYDRILRTPKTVPLPVTAQLGLGDEAGQRSYSAPINKENMDALPPGSPDSSVTNGGLSSSLSNISDAQAMSPQGEELDEGAGSTMGSQSLVPEDTGLPSETVDPLELMSGDSKSRSGGPLTPRPGTGGSRPPTGEGSRVGSASSHRSGRPGSNRHPVLPPIGSPSPVPVDPLPEY